ncbi:UDP-N-acetyl glucosamine 2-epimerase [Thalassospira sp.]|uniref:UDP-N-acetyl glucosamine 2-epimerase n=1 Tax=Thalassospira sp. TaxID=1912094 RepID=UPI00273484D4|nr:UDP-N-acetylglucosamine 2-epimerase [Thalassospira sp.]MDP2696937.1 UDP-N-acetylglucosamine 2-epimerase [Thalassospira sp.]
MIVDLVYGTRPNIIKAAAFYAAWRDADWPFELRLIDTGQHWDPFLAAQQCHVLGLPAPEHNLGVGQKSASGDDMIAITHRAYANLITQTRPAATITIGDVTGSVGIAQAAAMNNVLLCHIEAGLRGGEDAVAENANRQKIDRLSDLLWAPDDGAYANLRREMQEHRHIKMTGNIMIDALIRFPDGGKNIPKPHDIIVTLHRAGNVDDPERLGKIVGALRQIAQTRRILWPMHPRTRHCLQRYGLWSAIDNCHGITLCDSLPYPDFMAALRQCRAIITDSGGVQEECAWLGKPALILRDRTERAHTLNDVAIRLVSPSDLGEAITHLIATKTMPYRPAGWDGRSAERMLCHLTSVLTPKYRQDRHINCTGMITCNHNRQILPSEDFHVCD